MLILELAIILLATKLAGDLAVTLKMPAVLGKLLVGILIGPSILGLITDTDILKELSEIGVIILMFIAGLETDLQEFKKTAKASTFVGLGGIILPFIGGYAIGSIMDMGQFEAIFLGLLLTATSVSISVQSLKELGWLKSREGMTILGAAVIDDVLVIILLAFVVSLASGQDVNMLLLIAKKLGFFVIAALVAWKVVPWVMRWMAPLRVSESVISAGLIICFVYAYAAESFGVATIIGAYIAGIAISTTDYKHEVFEKIETIGYAVFVPVFFVSIGAAVSFAGLGQYVWLIIILSIVAVLTKLFGSAIGAKASGFGWRSSLGIGTGMVSRGEVALIIAAIGLENALLNSEMFTVMVIVVLVTTLVTPILLKMIFGDREPDLP